MVALRLADPADREALGAVYARAWRAAYAGLLPDEALVAVDRQDGLVPGARTILAEDSEGCAGFATVAPASDEDVGGCGELTGLYVDPARWRSGIGRVLITAARDALVGDGFAEAVLWVVSGNTRAESFYARDGWVADGATRDRCMGIPVAVRRYRRLLAPGPPGMGDASAPRGI
jgi:GNAT superfamily N-acetyltransferase